MGDNTENKLSDSIVRDAPNDIPISAINVSFFIVCIGFFLFDLILVSYLIFRVFLIIFVALIILIRVTVRVLLLCLVPIIDYVFFGAFLSPFFGFSRNKSRLCLVLLFSLDSCFDRIACMFRI